MEISFKKLREYQIKRLIKKAFKKIFEERKILDSNGYFPKVTKVELMDNGISVVINLFAICSYTEFKNQLDFIKTVFKAYLVNFSIIEGNCKLEIFVDPLELKNFSKINLSPNECLLGYNYNGNIIVNMEITPHILISGLSGQGKTQMAKTIIKNLEGKADIVLLNAFRGDFKDYKGRFITSTEGILNFLKNLLENKMERSRPLYVILDELLVLVRNKEITKILTDLLAVARHYNIFIIGIAQECTKENLKFKNLFNARVCFKVLEESSYRVILGCTVQEQLQKQEFYVYSNGLYKGRTFNNLD